MGIAFAIVTVASGFTVGGASDPAHAVTVITVTTTADTVDPNDGLTSLREAVDEANTLAGPSDAEAEIRFSADTTYTLDRCGVAEVDEDANATGDLDVIATGLRVFGGLSTTITNTCPGQRILHRPAGGTNSTSLNLYQINLTGGRGPNGIAVLWTGGLVLGASTVTDSIGPVLATPGLAAAVAFTRPAGGALSPEVKLFYSAITHTTNGGALKLGDMTGGAPVTDRLSLEGCDISDNRTNPENSEYYGSAGVSTSAVPDVSIRRCTFRRNDTTTLPAEILLDADGLPQLPQRGLENEYYGKYVAGAVAGSSPGKPGRIEDSVFEDNRGLFAGAVVGSFEVHRSTLRRNVGYSVGALAAESVVDSLVENNLAYFVAGGSGRLVERSTFVGNRGGRIGGFVPTGETPTVRTSTFSSNRGAGVGALGFLQLPPRTPRPLVEASTFVDNQATGPTNRRNDLARDDPSVKVEVRGSVLASTAGGPSCQAALVTSLGGNVFADASCAATPQPSDLVGVDPMLGPLENHGGPTPTHAPHAGSPAIDRIAGDDATCATPGSIDQRGAARRQGVGCDSGAVEVAYGGYHPITPLRVYDSRLLGDAGKFGPGEARALPIVGPGGLPAAAVGTVVVNVTMANGTADSHLTLWDGIEPVPSTSAVNAGAGAATANMATVGLDPASGAITARNNSGSTHVIVDLMGWYDDGTHDPTPQDPSALPRACPCGDAFHAVSPTRVLDTRTGVGGPATPFDADERREVFISGLPLAQHPNVSQVTAVVVSITAIEPTTATHLRAWPNREPPDVSSVNAAPGRATANLAIVPVVHNNSFLLENHSGLTNVAVDFVGFFGQSSSPASGRYLRIAPVRVDDTRVGPVPSPLVAGVPRRVLVAPRILGLSGNLTGIMASTNTHLTLGPAGATPPATSNLNLLADEVRAVAVLVGTGAVSPPGPPLLPVAGVDLTTNAGSVHTALDLDGFFAH